MLDAEQAWRIIQQIGRGTTVVETSLTLRPGGAWHVACAVSPEAALLFDTLLPVVCNARDYVVAQLGQSLDGRIATVSGHSHYVTGEPSRIHLHRLRAVVDAVIVGAGTVQADDPQLTVRHVPGASPVRVVLDPNGRVSHDRRLFTDGGPPTWHVLRRGVTPAPGARPLYLADDEAMDVPHQLLARLAGHSLRRILVEGGGLTISRFIEAGCVNRLHAVVAPLLIGSGRPALQLPEIETLDQALRPPGRSYALGEDRLYDLDLSGL